MGYADWTIKDTFKCATCQLLIPLSYKQKHGSCEFQAKSGADKQKCIDIAENIALLEGMDQGAYRSMPVQISYGALVAGSPDLDTILAVSRALAANKTACPASLTIARLPETIRQIAAKGNQWEGFRGELNEFARRAQKSHVVRIGALSQQHKQLLTEAKPKLDADVYQEALAQLSSLEGSDFLGGDVIDFTKKKVVQLKYLTGKGPDMFKKRLLEAAEQLVGDIKPEKNEVPIENFRREISIVIINPDSPFSKAEVGKYQTVIEDVMSTSVKQATGKRPGLDTYLQTYESTFAYYVECVRVETPTQRLRFVRGHEDIKLRSTYPLKSKKEIAQLV